MLVLLMMSVRNESSIWWSNRLKFRHHSLLHVEINATTLVVLLAVAAAAAAVAAAAAAVAAAARIEFIDRRSLHQMHHSLHQMHHVELPHNHPL